MRFVLWALRGGCHVPQDSFEDYLLGAAGTDSDEERRLTPAGGRFTSPQGEPVTLTRGSACSSPCGPAGCALLCRPVPYCKLHGTCQIQRVLKSFGKKGPLCFLEPLHSPPQSRNSWVFVYQPRDICASKSKRTLSQKGTEDHRLQTLVCT